jgi:uncharacterized iron-regulated membrane protein
MTTLRAGALTHRRGEQSAPRLMDLRRVFVRLHRWVGFGLGGWFVLLGLTGGIMVWHDELDAWLNPQWFAAQLSCGDRADRSVARTLSVFAGAVPQAQAAMVMAPRTPGAPYSVWEPATPDGTRRQHFIDADCGRYLGMRVRGAMRLDRAHVVPAVFELHRSLLVGDVGHAAVGIGGLVLLGLAMSGLLLAWPRGAAAGRWRSVLTIKRGAATARVVYDLHRATGLWLLPFLLLMSVSGAWFCFPQQGRALIGSVLPTLPQGMQPIDAPAASRVTQGEPDALIELAEAQWPAAQWSRLQLPEGSRAYYEVRLLQRGEMRSDTGDTRVRLTAQGQVIAIRDPLHAPAGETVLAWLFPLHSAEVLGWAGRVAWSLFGLVPALLLGSSVWLWWRRQRVRRASSLFP